MYPNAFHQRHQPTRERTARDQSRRVIILLGLRQHVQYLIFIPSPRGFPPATPEQGSFRTCVHNPYLYSVQAVYICMCSMLCLVLLFCSCVPHFCNFDHQRTVIWLIPVRTIRYAVLAVSRLINNTRTCRHAHKSRNGSHLVSPRLTYT